MSITATATRPSGRGTALFLGLVTVGALYYVALAAVPYLSVSEAQFGPYWPRRWWLLLHLSTGTAALLAGPVQLWLGLADRRMELHRRLGIFYMVAIGLSAIAAYYLAFHTDVGWIFGLGLVGLATAWLIATGMALVAIRRHLVEQHKEWMIRSYVLTTAFITFRVFQSVTSALGVGTVLEQLAAASWFCWTVPMVITEVVLQGRKILAVKP